MTNDEKEIQFTALELMDKDKFHDGLSNDKTNVDYNGELINLDKPFRVRDHDYLGYEQTLQIGSKLGAVMKAKGETINKNRQVVKSAKEV